MNHINTLVVESRKDLVAKLLSLLPTGSNKITSGYTNKAIFFLEDFLDKLDIDPDTALVKVRDSHPHIATDYILCLTLNLDEEKIDELEYVINNLTRAMVDAWLGNDDYKSRKQVANLLGYKNWYMLQNKTKEDEACLA